MFKRFIQLEWKAFFRSAGFGKSLGLKIFLVFLALYFAGMFLFVGLGLYPILKKNFPDEDPLQVVNNVVLSWLVLELIFRFMLQSLPIVDVKPLLILPIKKRKIVNFVLSKSLYSFYNFLPLLIIIPFGLMLIFRGNFQALHILAWVITVTGLSLSVNFLNFIIKKKFAENLSALLPFLSIAAVLVILDYFEIFESSVWFGKGLALLEEHPYLAVIPLLLLLFLFKLNQISLERRFYLDASLKQKEETADTKEFLWVRKFGEIAPFLQQDLKLIGRNKRPRTTIYLSLFLLGYGLLFYHNETYLEMPSFLVFVGVFITGVFMINFGQFIPAWDASYYPMIMTQNIPINRYLAAKAGLMTISIVVLTILSSPYIYFGWRILFVNIICAVYNIGVNIPVLLYMGSYNRKRIDLDKSPFLNYQGTGATQWLAAIPLILVPVFICWILDHFVSFEIALAMLMGLGITGILLRKRALNIISERYIRNKYAMIEGFKQTGE